MHNWKPTRLSHSGIPVEFQCVDSAAAPGNPWISEVAGCLLRWGWTGTEWGYYLSEPPETTEQTVLSGPGFG